MTYVQFGINIPTSSAAGSNPIGLARAAEAAGFDFVSANDHFHATGPRHELWTLMAWIAASTSRIGVASRVLGLPFRNPAVVAKMAESFDRLSDGRLILGLGAGASDEEFRALGIAIRPLRQRLDGLEEAIRLTRGLWSEDSFSYAGRIYRVEAAEIEPKPNRSIPIWLGTHGARGLAMTGRLADGWIASIEFAPPERAVAMIETIRTAAEDVGRDPDALRLVYNLPVSIGSSDSADPHRLTGSTDAITQRLIELKGLGFNAFNLIAVSDSADEVTRLGGEVLPAVRAAA